MDNAGMVKFTLRDNNNEMSMRMSLPPEESVMEIALTAAEYWDEKDFLLRDGYRLVDTGGTVGQFIRDGDLVELIPDPRAFGF